MSAVETSRAEAIALVQQIMQADDASGDEVDGWLDRLDRALWRFPVVHAARVTAPPRRWLLHRP
ncbi:e9imm peptide [Streptomyces sp. 900105755]